MSARRVVFLLAGVTLPVLLYVLLTAAQIAFDLTAAGDYQQAIGG